MPLKIGVIGCGYIARLHFEALAEIGAIAAWACDRDQAAAQRWAQASGARVTADAAEVFADPAVDAVVIATTSSSHPALCLAAIAAGKAVICEKTLATEPVAAAAVTTAARAAGRPFFTSYMKRYIPAIERAKELLPRIGRVLTMNIRSRQPWGDAWTAAPETGRSLFVERYGGGILTMGGSHMIDLVGYLLGRPKRVYALTRTVPGRDHELLASALMDVGDATVHFEALGHPLGRIGFLRDGWDEGFEIIGTEGRLMVSSSIWDQVATKASLLVHDDNASGQATEHRFAPCSPFARAHRRFHTDIVANTQSCQPITSGYDVDEIIAAMLASAAGGRAIDVPWRLAADGRAVAAGGKAA